MQEYEYKLVRGTPTPGVHHAMTDGPRNPLLGALIPAGREGWEAVSMVGDAETAVVLLKRPTSAGDSDPGVLLH